MTAKPLNINGLIRDSREIMLLLGVTEAADVLPELTKRLALPQHVEQARGDLDALWLHECGGAWQFPFVKDSTLCPTCYKTGRWRPLLVVAAPAPEPGGAR